MDRASKPPRICGRPTELLSENARLLVRDKFGQPPPARSDGLTRFLALKVNRLSGSVQRRSQNRINSAEMAGARQISPVAILATRLAAPITSPGRIPPWHRDEGG